MQNSSAESLISKMVSSGEKVEIDLARSILERKEETLPYLMDIMRIDRYWKSSGIEGWAPINAMHLLATMGGDKALDAIIYATYNFTEEIGDWLTEDLPSVLAYFGPSAFDKLASALCDGKLEPFARNTVGRALHTIARKNENMREKIIQVFVKAITDEKDMLARTLLVDVLIEFKEENTLPLVRSLFSRNLLDRSCLQPGEVEDVYAGRYDDIMHKDDADPMDLFVNDKQKWYEPDSKRSTTPGQMDVVPEVVPHAVERRPEQDIDIHKPKIGRNEPCPCGSGKKYKKCCLIKERIAA